MLPGVEIRGLPPRSEDLVSGQWLPGELLGTWRSDWPAVLGATRLTDCTCQAPQCRGAMLDVSSAVGVHEVDWAARSGRLEIGVARGADASRVLDLALRFGFGTLLLDRVWGWVTDTAASGAALTAAGLRREAALPRAVWAREHLVDRELWVGRRDG